MGILRADIVSHSSLATAGGSVLFDGVDDALKTADSDTYALKTNDFTIECWFYSTSNNAYDCWFSNDDYASGTGGIALYKNNSQLTAIVNPSGAQIFDGHGTVSLNTWHHVAFVRQSGNYRYYLNGEIIGESATQGSYNIVGNSFIIGANNYSNAYPNYEWPGYISNVRVVNGRAVYGPGNFTVPKFKLKNIPGTVLLCCQSSSSTTEAAVGDGALSANSAPVASGFAPYLKEDITDTGVVFEDNTKFDTLSYMVPPGGRTDQRGRGTALYGGGYKTPSAITAIDYLSIQHGGLTQEWGNLSTTQLASGAALGSYTRWVTAGGWTGANNNAIEYVTFTTQGNSLEFGDLVVGRRNTAAVSNSTRGIWGGGYIAPADAGTDSMDYITIATTANAIDFGNLSAASKSGGVAGSTTRAVWALGLVAPADNNTLEYVTIATTGNVTNFGDMPSGSNGRDVSGCSSNVRGIYGGGQYPTEVNIINYITIATTGDAVDFGDLTLARGQIGATSNGIRGVFMGGTTNPARVDNIDSVIIATTGNAVNWGDFRTAKTGLNSAASDSHGGLS